MKLFYVVEIVSDIRKRVYQDAIESTSSYADISSVVQNLQRRIKTQDSIEFRGTVYDLTKQTIDVFVESEEGVRQTFFETNQVEEVRAQKTPEKKPAPWISPEERRKKEKAARHRRYDREREQARKERKLEQEKWREHRRIKKLKKLRKKQQREFNRLKQENASSKKSPGKDSKKS